MKNLNKQAMVLIICVVAICVICISSVSYAYFAVNILGNNKAKDMNVNAGKMEITYFDSNEVTVSDMFPGDQIVKRFKVKNTGTLGAEYNIKLIVETNEFEDRGDLEVSLTRDGITPVNNILPGTGESGYILIGEKMTNKDEIHDYTLTLTFKNDIEDPNQNDNQNKHVKFKIGVDGEDEVSLYEYTPPAKTIPFSNIIVANGETIFADDPAGNIRYAGVDPNNYIWFNCDNYSLVTDAASAQTQNCEKWRIIGLMKNITLANGGGQQDLVKIIRDKPLNIDLSWDGTNYTETNTNLRSHNNDWSTSELMYLLNEGYDNHKAKTSVNGEAESANNSLYWNSGKGKCYTNQTILTDCDFSTTGIKQEGQTKNMIEEVKWNLGGLSNFSAENYYGTATTSTWYKYERLAEVPSNHQTEWIGKIGLMYPSDYGYATSGGSSKDRNACLAEPLYNWRTGDFQTYCAGNSWLKPSSGYLWTLTPDSAYSYNVFFVDSDGYLHYWSAPTPYSVRPSLYLKSSVKIASEGGNGSAEQPYILVS